MLDGINLAAVIVGVAIVFAALLIGYFGVLREWTVRRGETSVHASRASATAADDLQFLQSLSSGDLVSTSGADSPSQRERAGPVGTSQAERLTKS